MVPLLQHDVQPRVAVSVRPPCPGVEAGRRVRRGLRDGLLLRRPCWGVLVGVGPWR
jgi:hypothetical protein